MKNLILVVLLAVGCAHKPVVVEQPKPAPVVVPAVVPAPVLQPVPEPPPPVQAVEPVRTCEFTSIHFEFDSAVVTAWNQVFVSQDASCIKLKGVSVEVSGNADERGTDEYNMALGEQRAQAVKHILVLLGVSGEKLHAVSYGESRPSCLEHDENCWTKNRRVDITQK